MDHEDLLRAVEACNAGPERDLAFKYLARITGGNAYASDEHTLLCLVAAAGTDELAELALELDPAFPSEHDGSQ